MNVAAGILVLAGAVFVVAGSIGLLSFRTFYERVHPPTMGATLGAAFIIAACVLHFSDVQGRVVLHHVLVGLFMLVTTPVTYMILVRAALQRDAAEGNDPLGPPDSAIPKAAPGGVQAPPEGAP